MSQKKSDRANETEDLLMLPPPSVMPALDPKHRRGVLAVAPSARKNFCMVAFGRGRSRQLFFLLRDVLEAYGQIDQKRFVKGSVLDFMALELPEDQRPDGKHNPVNYVARIIYKDEVDELKERAAREAEQIAEMKAREAEIEASRPEVTGQRPQARPQRKPIEKIEFAEGDLIVADIFRRDRVRGEGLVVRPLNWDAGFVHVFPQLFTRGGRLVRCESHHRPTDVFLSLRHGIWLSQDEVVREAERQGRLLMRVRLQEKGPAAEVLCLYREGMDIAPYLRESTAGERGVPERLQIGDGAVVKLDRFNPTHDFFMASVVAAVTEDGEEIVAPDGFERVFIHRNQVPDDVTLEHNGEYVVTIVGDDKKLVAGRVQGVYVSDDGEGGVENLAEHRRRRRQ